MSRRSNILKGLILICMLLILSGGGGFGAAYYVMHHNIDSIPIINSLPYFTKNDPSNVEFFEEQIQVTEDVTEETKEKK